MSEGTEIQWADSSWNPWIGCTKVSAGCAHCYAEHTTMARRERSHGREIWGKGNPRYLVKDWTKPEAWNRKPWVCDDCGHASELEHGNCPATGEVTRHRRRVFPSLCDWLDDEVPIEWFARLLDLIRRTPNLDWLLLTKRTDNWESRLKEAFYAVVLEGDCAFMVKEWLDGNPPANVWLGTSVENQQCADERIPRLLSVPAKVRFLSCEPLLGPVDFNPEWLGQDNVSWVIVGGES